MIFSFYLFNGHFIFLHLFSLPFLLLIEGILWALLLSVKNKIVHLLKWCSGGLRYKQLAANYFVLGSFKLLLSIQFIYVCIVISQYHEGCSYNIYT